VHRNLKPSGLFITDDGSVKIEDLAFCRFLNPEAQLTGQPGTVYYHAPDICEEGQYTEKADVFAFGLILYEILALKPVFPPDLPLHSVMKKLVEEHFVEIPDDFLRCVKELLGRCWWINPQARPLFEEILLYLKDNRHQICRGVEADAVQAFFDALESGIELIKINTLRLRIMDASSVRSYDASL
jgi:serine/threonine protein kinase